MKVLLLRTGGVVGVCSPHRMSGQKQLLLASVPTRDEMNTLHDQWERVKRKEKSIKKKKSSFGNTVICDLTALTETKTRITRDVVRQPAEKSRIVCQRRPWMLSHPCKSFSPVRPLCSSDETHERCTLYAVRSINSLRCFRFISFHPTPKRKSRQTPVALHPPAHIFTRSR